MLLPRLPRAFTRKFHKIENKRERTIQGNFLIPVPPGSEIPNVFPKRVELGEVLVETGSLRILAPVNGVASLTESRSHFQIKQDGGWRTQSPYSSKSYTYEELLNTFQKGALASLDFPSVSLQTYFSYFSSQKEFNIILSPYSRYNHLDFKEMIESEMADAFSQFGALLQSVFPKAVLQNYFLAEKLEYKHPDGIPEYLIHTKMGLGIEEANHSLRHCELLYLGAETIFHILRMLYYGEPFTRRHLSVCLVDKKGRLDTEPRQFLLTNGQALDFIPQNIDQRYKVASFQGMFEPIQSVEIHSLGNFNIYEHYNLTLYERLPVIRNEFACIDCYECNTYCPTKANPLALVKTREDEFLKSSCIECGICTLYCPSGIDIRARILEAKES